ncbi:hypothetical protein UNPF46_21380 [Bradyrhizobium sp. UNPF46]|nr:hypothetical protein UNPF46_21380 [Bradyrhizobium sp. UNPF46]
MSPARPHRPFVSPAIQLGVLGLVVLYTLSPLATILVESLIPGRNQAPSDSLLTLRAYRDAVADSTLRQAIFNSLVIAVTTGLLSGILGFLSARLVHELSARLVLACMIVTSIPAILPPIISGFSLHVYYQLIGIDGTLIGILAAHVIYVSPIAFFLLYIAESGLNPEIEDCARNMGASEMQIAAQIAFPQLANVFVGASTICALVSWNEFMITWFVSGFQKTMPTVIYGMMGNTLDPSLYAAGTLVTLLSFVLMVSSAVLMRKQIMYGLARR